MRVMMAECFAGSIFKHLNAEFQCMNPWGCKICKWKPWNCSHTLELTLAAFIYLLFISDKTDSDDGDEVCCALCKHVNSPSDHRNKIKHPKPQHHTHTHQEAPHEENKKRHNINFVHTSLPPSPNTHTHKVLYMQNSWHPNNGWSYINAISDIRFASLALVCALKTEN